LASSLYAVVIRPEAQAELAALRVFDRRKVTDAIRAGLLHDPFAANRNRKPLPGLVPAFEHVPPVWELRVGEYRVFYDGDEASRTVYVRAVRHKPSGATAEEITR
jgi:mRNA-degrading endonuclease RelE of RelBE toxin-antitoxin system